MNAFRLAADMTHLFSVAVLLLKIYTTKSCSGILLKTQELYLIVFVARYLDLFVDFISLYDSVMKFLFISTSVATVWCMRRHPLVRRTYDKELDSVLHYVLVIGSLLVALLVCFRFPIIEIFWAFSIFLEAGSILPQLVMLQKSGNVDNLTVQYIFFLGSYRAIYILNWIYRYLFETYRTYLIVWIAAIVQTCLYADFFYYYYLSWKNNTKLRLPD